MLSYPIHPPKKVKKKYLTNYISFLTVKLFEFDKRFVTFGEDFVFYDYNSPLQFTQVNSRF